jgi:hypothetical protein
MRIHVCLCKQASSWLQRFRSQPEAWDVCMHVVTNTDTYSAEHSLFASQVLRYCAYKCVPTTELWAAQALEALIHTHKHTHPNHNTPTATQVLNQFLPRVP